MSGWDCLHILKHKSDQIYNFDPQLETKNPWNNRLRLQIIVSFHHLTVISNPYGKQYCLCIASFLPSSFSFLHQLFWVLGAPHTYILCRDSLFAMINLNFDPGSQNYTNISLRSSILEAKVNKLTILKATQETILVGQSIFRQNKFLHGQ